MAEHIHSSTQTIYRTGAFFWSKGEYSLVTTAGSGQHPIRVHTTSTTAEGGVKGLYGTCKFKAALAEVTVGFAKLSAEQVVSGYPAARWEPLREKQEQDKDVGGHKNWCWNQTNAALPTLQQTALRIAVLRVVFSSLWKSFYLSDALF